MDVDNAIRTIAPRGIAAVERAGAKRDLTRPPKMPLWPILNLLLWLAWVAFASWKVVTHPDTWSWPMVAYLLCFLPIVLVAIMVTLYRWSVSSSAFGLSRSTGSEDPALTDAHWRAVTERALRVWECERQRFCQDWRAVAAHGVTFALVSTLTLVLCLIIVAPYLRAGADRPPSQTVLIAIAVGTATAVAFVNDLGRIVFRLALHDAGVEVFSFATKNSISVVAAALLFSTLLGSGLAQLDHTAVPPPAASTPVQAGAAPPATDLGGQPDAGKRIPLGIPGFIVIGATIAFIGGRAVRFISDRAAGVLGMTPSRAPENSDLTQIEGLGEDDIARLAEEGVDSLHALAFTPLPRLLFSTRYGLERLCDWQDQALLLVHVGQDKARLMRAHMLVRGAIGAQDAARALFPDTPEHTVRPEQDKAVNLLGFPTRAHAELALKQIADDEIVSRLRFYASATHTLEPSGA